MPKRVPPLSAKALDAVRPSTKAIELSDGYVPGLRVRILPTGQKSWSLNIHDSTGKRCRFHVGNGLGLAEARRKGEEIRRAVQNGENPTAQKRAARQRAQDAQDGVGTLGALIEMYFTIGPGSQRPRSAKNKQLLKTVFQDVLGVPLLDLQRATVQLIADNWRSAQSASLAVRLLRPCFKWAAKRGLTSEGVAEIDPPCSVGRRDRVLNNDELCRIWPYLTGAHGEVMRWLLWTGCRLSEAAEMRWGELAGDCWIIPATRAKSGRQRTVPLPRQALEFLGQRRATQQHDATPHHDQLVFPSKRGGVLSNWDRETKRILNNSGTAGWHRHDLRRTVATIIGDLGFPPHVISVVLGHANVAEGATAVYARSRYEREHREALQALADEIERAAQLIDGAPHQVVPSVA